MEVHLGIPDICSPFLLDAHEATLIFVDTGGNKWLIENGKRVRIIEVDDMDDRPAPQQPGWCFKIGSGDNVKLFWCNEVGWAKWAGEDWDAMNDPHIMLTLDNELEQGDFASKADDHKYFAHVEADFDIIVWESAFLTTGSGKIEYKDDNTSTSLAFKPVSEPSGRSYPLSYTVKASIGSISQSKNITQDGLSKIRQQYVDLNRKLYKKPPPYVPARGAFKQNLKSANYGHADAYARIDNDRYYNWGIMYLGSKTEAIRKAEGDSMTFDGKKYYPRVTSGYRPPEDCDGNSLHQFGFAVDMNPHSEKNTPPHRKAMERRVRRLLGVENYDTIRHGKDEHIHFEKQTVAQGGSPDK